MCPTGSVHGRSSICVYLAAPLVVSFCFNFPILARRVTLTAHMHLHRGHSLPWLCMLAIVQRRKIWQACCLQ